MIIDEKIKAVVEYGEAKHFKGYKEGYIIGFITGLLIGIISINIIDTLKA
jgi:hypothetical protein